MKRPTDILKVIKDWIERQDFLMKIFGLVHRAGVQITYSALLLSLAYKRKETPKWAKRIVLGALAYLLAPVDAIPDLSPFLGFTDDLGVLLFGLVSIAGYVNQDVRERAREILGQWIPDLDQEDLAEVDQKLGY